MTNVAVVVLDTLRYDSFEEHFEWLEGRRFSNAYSTSHWTIPAHASLYTGFYPSEVDVHGKSMSLDCDLPVLPELLQSRGYRTRLLTANPQIHMWDGWQRGYDTTVGPSNLDPSDDDLVDWTEFYSRQYDSALNKYLGALWYCIASDSPTLPSMWKGIKNEPANAGITSIVDRVKGMEFGSEEFLFVNVMDAHTPYDPPEAYTDVETPVEVVTGDGFAGTVDDPEEVRQVYDDSVRYLSDRYEELYAQLRTEFDYVVTVGDHGEMLGEHGMWNHSYGLYPELVHVPLVIGGRGVDDRTDETVVSVLDVHRTVCDLAGIEAESRGQNLLDEPHPEDRLFEYQGFLHWHRDQFERKGVDDVYEEYDRRLDGFVSASADYIFESHDDGLVVDGSLDATEATERLESLIARVDRSETASETDPDAVSNDVQERLEDLGYA